MWWVGDPEAGQQEVPWTWGSTSEGVLEEVLYWGKHIKGKVL